jgi:hypothetical protein
MADNSFGIPASTELYEDTALNIEKDRDSASNDPPSTIEKGEFVQTEVEVDDGIEYLSHEDPFPLIEGLPVEPHQFTFRAVFVGCCLGGVIAASK